MIKQRRVQGTIHRAKNSYGEWVGKDDDIAQEAVEYFSGLFSGSIDSSSGDLVHLIPSMVTSEENAFLEEVPDVEEVRHMVFTMDGESAAGPDGFIGSSSRSHGISLLRTCIERW